MKAYIASSLDNYKRVLGLRDRLYDLGVTLTYDWATLVDYNRLYGKKETEEDWEQIAVSEVRGVSDASVLLFVTPAGRGSHFELGMAYAWGIPVVILEDQAKNDIAFYTLTGMERFNNENAAIERVVEHVLYSQERSL